MLTIISLLIVHIFINYAPFSVEHILSRYERCITEAGERTNNGAGGQLVSNSVSSVGHFTHETNGNLYNELTTCEMF